VPTSPHPSPRPPAGPDSELPSVGARILAFVAVFIGGAAGGLIGYAFADLGGFAGAGAGAVTLLSALVGAGGVAVVAVLTLRAFGEWRTIRKRTDGPVRPSDGTLPGPRTGR
jgi:hypothetical protein